MEPGSSALQVDSLPTELSGKPNLLIETYTCMQRFIAKEAHGYGIKDGKY